MAYTIPLCDDRKRYATVIGIAPRRGSNTNLRTADGRQPRAARLIKSTEDSCLEALLKQHDGNLDAISEALVTGDPELPLEQLGRHLPQAARVYLKNDGSVLYAARMLRVVTDSAGHEVSREDFVDVEATVAEEGGPLPWTGRLMPIGDAVRRFAMVRKLQLRHVNGLTYDFLYDIAKTLTEAGKMLVMGSGSKGRNPLIFSKNGSPYRGFLEGRIDGESFRLVLHLSNLELKAPSSE